MGTGHRIPPGDIDNLLLQQWGSSQDGTPWGHIHVPMFKQVILDSQTTVTGSGTGTWLTGLGFFKQVDIYVRLTTAGGTSPTLDLYVDSRLDGTNVANLAHLTQITTDATAAVAVRLSKPLGTNTEVTAMEDDAGAGTIRNLGWGDDLRIRRNIAGTSPVYSYVATINCVT